MASWNRASSGNSGYWSAQTKMTTVSYGSPGYGYAHSPPRSHSPPPIRAVSYDYYNNKHQNNGMGAVTYGEEDHSYIKKTQTNGMGAYGQENHGYTKKTQTNGSHDHGGFFGELVPSSFPPGTDPKVVSCFKNVDRDGSGFIDEKELKMALSSYSSTFSLRTVRLIIYAFARTNSKVVGPKEFIAVYYGLQQWKAMFQKFDRDRNGKIDMSELREALRSLGYPVSEAVLDMLVLKFDKTSGNRMAIGFDGFIECCITVKGLSDKFKEKDQMMTGSATFSYEAFMMTVLPFIVA